MNKIILNVASSAPCKYYVFVDGKLVPFRYRKKTQRYEIVSKKEKVLLSIHSAGEKESHLWLFFDLFRFIISVFGLFDRYSNNNPKRMNFDSVLTFDGTKEIKLVPDFFREGGAVFKDLPSNIEVRRNEYSTNKKILHRCRFAKLVKALFWVILLGSFASLFVLHYLGKIDITPILEKAKNIFAK